MKDVMGAVSNWLYKFKRSAEQEEKFPEKVWDRLEKGPADDNMIVARGMASTNRLNRWIVIYKRKTSDIRDQYFQLRYTIHEFEVPASSGIADTSDKVNKKTWYVRKEEEIYELLHRLGISPGNFNIPAQSSYPFVSA